MKKKIVYKRIIGFLAVAIILQRIAPASVRGAADEEAGYGKEIAASGERIAEITKKSEELSERLNVLRASGNDLRENLQELDTELMNLYTELSQTSDELAITREKAENASEEALNMGELADERYRIMKERIRYMYEEGNPSLFEILISGGGITAFFENLEYRRAVTQYDNNLLKEYKAAKEKAAQAEELMNIRSGELSAELAFYGEQLDLLNEITDRKAAEMEALTEELGISEEMLFEYWDELRDEKNNLEELLRLEDERIAEEERKRKEAEEWAAARDIKNILWPLPGRKYISSYFGYREDPFGGTSTSFHRGIDIPANTGTPVRAVLAGTVIAATYDASSGNYIKIDHGNDIVSVYCHASKLLVKKGDVVERGQTIMEVGTTGMSTGPHLHFGLNFGSTPVNPLDHVSPE